MSLKNSLLSRISKAIKNENSLIVLKECVEYVSAMQSSDYDKKNEVYRDILDTFRDQKSVDSAVELVELLRCKQIYKCCKYADKCNLDRTTCKKMKEKAERGTSKWKK